MTVTETLFRARYNETDKMGIVHHSQYVNWFELGRTDWVKKAGITYRKIEEAGIMLMVIGIEAHYHSPAFYDDLIRVETAIMDYDSIQIKFQYKVFHNESGKLLVDGNSTHCWTALNRKPLSLRKRKPELHQIILDKMEN